MSIRRPSRRHGRDQQAERRSQHADDDEQLDAASDPVCQHAPADASADAADLHGRRHPSGRDQRPFEVDDQHGDDEGEQAELIAGIGQPDDGKPAQCGMAERGVHAIEKAAADACAGIAVLVPFGTLEPQGDRHSNEQKNAGDDGTAPAKPYAQRGQQERCQHAAQRRAGLLDREYQIAPARRRKAPQQMRGGRIGDAVGQPGRRWNIAQQRRGRRWRTRQWRCRPRRPRQSSWMPQLRSGARKDRRNRREQARQRYRSG